MCSHSHESLHSFYIKYILKCTWVFLDASLYKAVAAFGESTYFFSWDLGKTRCIGFVEHTIIPATTFQEFTTKGPLLCVLRRHEKISQLGVYHKIASLVLWQTFFKMKNQPRARSVSGRPCFFFLWLCLSANQSGPFGCNSGDFSLY